jgi:hypothetical protein
MGEPGQDARRKLLPGFQQRFRTTFPSLKGLTSSAAESDRNNSNQSDGFSLRLGLDMEYYPQDDEEPSMELLLGLFHEAMKEDFGLDVRKWPFQVVLPHDGFVASAKETDLVKALLLVLCSRHMKIEAEKSAKSRSKYLHELDIYVAKMTPRMQAAAREAKLEGSKRLEYKVEDFLKKHREAFQEKRELLKKRDDVGRDHSRRQQHHHHQGSSSGGSSSSLRRMALLSAMNEKVPRVQL